MLPLRRTTTQFGCDFQAAEFFFSYITASDFQSFIGMITRDEAQCICMKRLVQILRPVAEPKV